MSEKLKEGGLILAEPQADLSIFGDNKASFLTSISAQGRQLWAITAKMQGSGIVPLQDNLNVPIALVNWYVHKVHVRAVSNGEMVPAIRSVLMAADGKLYDSVANGIANSLGTIARAFGIKTLNPPLNVIAKTIETRAGFRTMVLEPAEE